MKLLTSLILIFSSALSTFGQLVQCGIIYDKDGLTNVRKEPNIKAEIVYKLKSGEAFSIDIDYLKFGSSWIKIGVPKNSFSIKNGQPDSYDIVGFVHKSRVKLLESTTKISNPNVFLDFSITKADTKKKVDEKHFTINGQVPFGLEIPIAESYEVKSLRLYWKGKFIEVDKNLYNDLYNVSFEEGFYNSKGNRFKTYFQNDTYYIQQDCADGAGFYQIVWVIRKGKITQRLVMEI